MTPAAQTFVEANKASPVVEGWAHEPDPRLPAKGGTYVLEDGRRFKLTAEDSRSLPDGFPDWGFAT